MRRPLFIARQARNPTGLLGKLIASIMAHETRRANMNAIEALSVQPNDHVLDIGCGNGVSLELLSRTAPEGRVAGVDPSGLMVHRAIARNQDNVKDGRVKVSVAAVEHLPFADASFDKVMSVHTIYFWEDIDRALAEIARVTRPGGLLALVLRTSDGGNATAAFPDQVYRFRSAAEISDALVGAGYKVNAIAGLAEAGASMLLKAEKHTS